MRIGLLGLGAALAFALGGSSAWSHPGAGIVVDGKGQVYFVHGIRNRILKLDSAGTVSTFVQGAEGKELSNPHHLALDQDGNLFTVGDRDGKVFKAAANGKLTQVYPPQNWYGVGFLGAGGDPFTISSSGVIYCVHYRQFEHCQILTIGQGGRLASLAGGDWGYADGKGTQARFSNLHGAAFAMCADGSLLLTDNGSSVRKVAPDGTVTTVAGGKEDGFADGPAGQARFRGAVGLTVGSRGEIYVADASNRRIRRIGPDGMVSTVAGSGQRGGADGPALLATFEEPTGVAVASDETLFILDHLANGPRVRKLAPNGKVTTVAEVK